MKPYYYTFEWKDRVITLCLIDTTVKEYFQFPVPTGLLTKEECYIEKHFLYMGYSVKIPNDEMNEDFAKDISLGRAKKYKTRRNLGKLNSEIIKDKGVLKAIARNCERNIKNGTIVIKGIR